MRPFPALATLGLAALLAAATAQAAGEVYKWTDDAGVVQYTDSPPDGRPYEKMKSDSRVATPIPAESAEAAAPQSTALGETTGGAADALKSNCDIAKGNIEMINKFPQVTMDRDGDGKAEVLSADERIAELTRNEGLAKLYCAEGAPGS